MGKKLLVCVLLLTVLLTGAMSLIHAAGSLREAQALNAGLQSERAMLEGENAALRADLQASGTEEAEKALAEDFFGFVDAEEIIFEDRG